MERYGWITSEVELSNCFPSKKIHILDVNHNFFKKLDDCIRNALSHNTSMEKDKHHYLKILKTSDVIHHIHDINSDNYYGYIYLRFKKDANFEKISLFSHCSTLFHDMLDCVTAQKCFKELSNSGEEEEVGEYSDIKIAYFILLKDNDLLHELSRSM